MPDLMFLAQCVLLGAFAGFAGGMLGIGGGVVIVPVLVLLLDARELVAHADVTRVAVATSLTTIVFSSFAAARAQVQRGAVRWDIAKPWAPALLAGSLAAGMLAGTVPSFAARLFIGAFLLLVAVIMLASWSPAPHRQLPATAGSVAIGGLAGVISGFAGIGGGNVIVPSLVYFNVPIHQASATASALAVPIAFFGALGYVFARTGGTAMPTLSLGYVYLPAAAAIVVTSVLTAPLGVAAAHKVPAPKLKRLFGAFVGLAALRMLYSAIAA